MAVTAFFTRFKDLAFREMRACTVPPGKEIPAGGYGFLEFYCDDAGCDCRRVMIKVLGQGSGRRSAMAGKSRRSTRNGRVQP